MPSIIGELVPPSPATTSDTSLQCMHMTCMATPFLLGVRETGVLLATQAASPPRPLPPRVVRTLPLKTIVFTAPLRPAWASSSSHGTRQGRCAVVAIVTPPFPISRGSSYQNPKSSSLILTPLGCMRGNISTLINRMAGSPLFDMGVRFRLCKPQRFLGVT